jgi:hypothetical protein
MVLVQVQTAKAKRVCTKCTKAIPKGDKCLTFQKNDGALSVSANLCKDCLRVALEEVECAWAVSANKNNQTG